MKSNAFDNPHPMIQNKVPEFKVILVGSSGVGKTCIVVRASKDLY
jgi:GTPase SAR1 family protein